MIPLGLESDLFWWGTRGWSMPNGICPTHHTQECETYLVLWATECSLVVHYSIMNNGTTIFWQRKYHYMSQMFSLCRDIRCVNTCNSYITSFSLRHHGPWLGGKDACPQWAGCGFYSPCRRGAHRHSPPNYDGGSLDLVIWVPQSPLGRYHVRYFQGTSGLLASTIVWHYYGIQYARLRCLRTVALAVAPWRSPLQPWERTGYTLTGR